MKIIDFFDNNHPIVSFEFFPPKTESGVRRLFDTIDTLKDLHPSYVSVTYGAMGSTREKTVGLVQEIKHQLGIEAMCHLSCIGATQDEIAAVLDELGETGIDNVLALGGDPPPDQDHIPPAANGFTHANELAAFIRSRGGFCIGGACYPEGHIAARSKDEDLQYCKRKVEDGVDFLITQLFFDNRDYFDFVRRARMAGIDVPIIPGIMPITNFTQIKRFSKICGSTIPAQIVRDLTPIEEDLEAVEAYGITYATEQCRKLLEDGVPGLHFYTLNKPRATSQILGSLG